MATTSQIQNAVNTFVDAIWQDLVDAQEAYFALHGKYMQILPSPAVIPDDGATSDFTIVLPTDEIWGHDFSFTISTKIPCQIYMDNHGNATQHGFTLVLTFSKDGVKYRKQINYNFGGATTDWYELYPFSI